MSTVGIVVGICSRHDAISSAAAGQAEMLRTLPGVDHVVLFTTHLDRSELDADVVVVPDGWQLLTRPEFAACDFVIFHWGIHTPLFDALWAVDASRAVVHFHNVTPPELAPPEARGILQQSLLQLELVTTVPVEVWTYSEFNRRTLLDIGVPESRIRFVPFVVEPPRELSPNRSNTTITMLCVGRIVPAKGVHVLIEAASQLDDEGPPWELVIAGNPDMSDPSYLDSLRELVEVSALDDRVRFVHPDSDELWRLFETAHLLVSPSFHEGLCVPVIEAYLAGCRVIGTDGGNLRYIVQPPDPVVPAGDAPALARALSAMILELAEHRGETDRPSVRDLVSSFSVQSVRRNLATELRRHLAS